MEELFEILIKRYPNHQELGRAISVNVWLSDSDPIGLTIHGVIVSLNLKINT